MKNLFLFTILIFSFSLTADAQKSPRIQADGEISQTKITVDYGAPSVKGRTIWGGLEAYDAVWRAGANKNTTISFDKGVKLGGQEIAAGKYGFFIIPKKDQDWVVILNRNNSSWGAYDYDEKQDALRLNIKPEWTDANQEQLEFSVGKSAINFAWENARLSIPVSGI